MRQSNAKEILLWLFRMRRGYRVKGDSMIPFLRADEEVLVNPAAYRRQPPCIGDVVVAWHPCRFDLQIIKRIVKVDKDGRYALCGDNPDPARNGFVVVPPALIEGRVTSRFVSPG